MPTPLILWNHRWEYDKNSDDFFKLLFDLQKKGYDFDVAILGEKYKKYPPVFDEAKTQLGEKVVHFGFANTFDDYKKWLKRADLYPVTSVHDFFGASVVEAIYCNCYPLLPNRLAYPEHVPKEFHTKHLYNDYAELLSKMEWCLANMEEVRAGNYSSFVEKYDWSKLTWRYDDEFEKLN